MKESLTKSEEARKKFEIENSLLTQKNGELELEYNQAVDKLATLADKQKVLESDYVVLKEKSQNNAPNLTATRALAKLPNAKDIIPQAIERFEQDKEVLRAQLEGLPHELETERNSLARSCKTLDELICDLKAGPSLKPNSPQGQIPQPSPRPPISQTQAPQVANKVIQGPSQGQAPQPSVKAPAPQTQAPQPTNKVVQEHEPTEKTTSLQEHLSQLANTPLFHHGIQ